MTLQQYSTIQLLADHNDKGVPQGAIGVILEVYGDEAYEVEFSREDGTTIAWFAVPQNEVKLYDEGISNETPPQQSRATPLT